MRSYKQHCGVARALDLLGERWTLLIIRDLLPGGRRYSDLLKSLGGITTNLLAKRLQHLEAQGIVRKRTLPPPAASTIYELTELGLELEPVVLSLGRFGARLLERVEDGHRGSLRWLMVSLGRRYAGGASPGILQVRAGSGAYWLRIGEQLRAFDGEHPEARATVIGPDLGFFAWLGAGKPVEGLPSLAIEGDGSWVSTLGAHLLDVTGRAR